MFLTIRLWVHVEIVILLVVTIIMENKIISRLSIDVWTCNISVLALCCKKKKVTPIPKTTRKKLF